METITFNNNTFEVENTYPVNDDYKYVQAKGTQTGKVFYFKVWSDGLVELFYKMKKFEQKEKQKKETYLVIDEGTGKVDNKIYF